MICWIDFWNSWIDVGIVYQYHFIENLSWEDSFKQAELNLKTQEEKDKVIKKIEVQCRSYLHVCDCSGDPGRIYSTQKACEECGA